MDLSENVFELLRTDEELALLRGRPGRPTASGCRPILLLRAVSEHRAPAAIRRLGHEYSLASEPRSAWAARPVALTEHQGRTTLVLEDPGGEPLDALLRAPMELGLFLRLAVGLASALRELHAQGVIHKDVKPANALGDIATGRVWLMGFGIASRLRRERQAPEPPDVIAGSLPYMAPEQTGRMNRSTDSRSDLYAAGVTLYEMLTGGLPFTASDPMEWVHCHIARRPAPPAERREDVPGVVSAIVLKLLAKTPEERYQTAAGVERDLRRCLRAWEAKRPIDDFPLGADDTPDRLLVPEKLYGRSREVDTLLAAFNRMVTSGKPELVLVSGYSGIGKSSVVNELHKVLVPPRGLFANPVFRVSEFWYWTRKAQARFLAGNYPSAVDASSRAHRLVGMSPSFLETAECHFYGALSRAASWDSASPGERRQHLEALTARHGQLQAWAELCPENFENRAALVGAEVARIEGRVLDAERLYEKAIRSAHINGFIHNEAVACEVAARFYAARGFDRIADVYLRDARYGYLRWGADGKVRQLDEEHPHLGKGEPAPAPKSTIGAPVENLELATVLKVSQAVSGAVVLAKLIDTLLRTAIEHA